ncbi:chalcone isomerase family protein [Vibrio genomosp. F10]|uniref:Chalcone isomerase domain-containing protein n=1 Tax=Vibrio genomosp. F10 TaxID=723171 RepID=A0A1B9QYM0_9VIBR|nr:chalcone isomerase family protein [Vibrio genomosp. F10]OCH75829.1 hypothetical protein A6E14_10390 [Vibrio genomosp. F10]OEF04729.1 hypothetical protein A1QK_09805 [Vibrio genomosp. F10 str. 9ZD137]
MYKWFCLCFLLISSTVLASPIRDLSKVGTGEMSYLFWTIYEAEYYSGQHAITGEPDKNRQALKIEYLKSIESKALIQATIEQWQHLNYDANDIEQWAASLENLWPNVEPGNTLTLLLEEDGRSEFYFNNELIGTIGSESFGTAFLSIWLSEKTSEPELRRQLLGLNR